MKHIKYLVLIGCTMFVLSCTPDYDAELGKPLTPSSLNYTVTQDPSYDNKVFLNSETSGVIPYWDYELGTSIRAQDTVIIPFKGDFWVKYRAMGGAGSIVDSTQITVSQFDPNFFSDPAWQLLTNGEDGKYWKLVAVKAGSPSTSKTFNDWGDVSWGSYQIGDSIRMDINKGFHLDRYRSGVLEPGRFGLNTAEVLEGTEEGKVIKSITALAGVKLPADDAGEMGNDYKNRFRIHKLSVDTLILGQGAYFTDNRKGEDWGYFFWYLRTPQ
jgi:hypothetical protein